jgi:hypothetical protein
MDYGLGVAFQYLRSMKNTPEWVRVLIFLGAAALLFYASPAGQSVHSFQSFIAGLFGTDGVVMHALAATTITSVGSNVAVRAGLPEAHPFVPITDSN